MNGWLKCSWFYLMVHIIVYDVDLAKYFVVNRIFEKPTHWKPKLILTRSRLAMKRKMISVSDTCMTLYMLVGAVVWKQSCVWVLTLSLFSPVWHFFKTFILQSFGVIFTVHCKMWHVMLKQIHVQIVFLIKLSAVWSLLPWNALHHVCVLELFCRGGNTISILVTSIHLRPTLFSCSDWCLISWHAFYSVIFRFTSCKFRSQTCRGELTRYSVNHSVEE